MPRISSLGEGGVDLAWSALDAAEDCQISSMDVSPSISTGVLGIESGGPASGKKLAAASSERRRLNGPLHQMVTSACSGLAVPASLVFVAICLQCVSVRYSLREPSG